MLILYSFFYSDFRPLNQRRQGRTNSRNYSEIYQKCLGLAITKIFSRKSENLWIILLSTHYKTISIIYNIFQKNKKMYRTPVVYAEIDYGRERYWDVGMLSRNRLLRKMGKMKKCKIWSLYIKHLNQFYFTSLLFAVSPIF